MNDIAKTQQDKVWRLEEALHAAPQVECPVRDLFAPGIYLREMTIPAGVVLVGAVHRTEHFSILSKGRIRVETESGLVDMVAPHTFISKPGAKRAGYAIEESVWTTVHANPDNITNMDDLVPMLCHSQANELLGGVNNKQIQANKARELEQS